MGGVSSTPETDNEKVEPCGLRGSGDASPSGKDDTWMEDEVSHTDSGGSENDPITGIEAVEMWS